MERFKFYNTYNETWAITPLIAVDYDKEKELIIALYWLCFGFTIILKSYENKKPASE